MVPIIVYRGTMQKIISIGVALTLSACASAGAVGSRADRFERQIVSYEENEKPGSIVIDTKKRFLYHVQANGKATRYGVGVGRAGFEWRGVAKVRRKAKWPAWRPPAEMIAREKKQYNRTLPAVMEGGV